MKDVKVRVGEDLKAGSVIRDNDPRGSYERLLTVWVANPGSKYIFAKEGTHKAHCRIRADRIYKKGVCRLSGFTVVEV